MNWLNFGSIIFAEIGNADCVRAVLQKKKHHQLRTVLCRRCRLLSHGKMITVVGGHGGYLGSKLFVTAEELREKLSHLHHEKALIVKLLLAEKLAKGRLFMRSTPELLYLYGFVIDDNTNDYLMSKTQLLEVQKAEMRCLLPKTSLDNGFFQLNTQNSEENNKSKDDEDKARNKGKEPLEGLGGPMTRARTKKAKEALQQVLTMLFEFRPKLQVEKLRIVNCTMFQEDWSGQRKMPSYVNKLVFREKFMTTLRTIAMQEDEVFKVSSMLEEVQYTTFYFSYFPWNEGLLAPAFVTETVFYLSLVSFLSRFSSFPTPSIS
ncbi:NO-associated protein 1, chloroplastic/mitochondrial [Glycine soja]